MSFLELLEQILQYLDQLILQYGSLGIALAMFAESAGVPFASSVVILTSGGLIFSGKVSFWSVLLSSTIGITLGSMLSYSIGFFGCNIGRFLRKNFFKKFVDREPNKKPIHRSKVYLLWERYGSFSVFMGQLWGVTRTFISFPAGAMHMNIMLFILYTALGGALFSLLAIGFSIFLTGALRLIVRYSSYLIGLSPWIWVSLFAVIAILIFLSWRRGWLSQLSMWRIKSKWTKR